MEDIEQCISTDVSDALVPAAPAELPASPGAKRVSIQWPVRVRTFGLSSWGKLLVCSCCCCSCFIILALVAAIAVFSTGAHRGPPRGALLSALERCPSAACRRYLHELRNSIDWQRNPCDDLYGFVCGRSGSVRARAEHGARLQALSSVLRGGGAVGDLVRSCLRRHRFRDGSLILLSRFLAERGLHWPGKLARPLLEVLVDLSVNWNMHLWFKLDITAVGGSRPVVVLRKGPNLLAWADAQSARRDIDYEHWMRKALAMFRVPGHKIADMVVVAKAMNSLVATLLGTAAGEPSPQQPQVTSLSGLSRYTGTTLWLDIMNERLTGTRFTGEDSVRLYDHDVIRVSVYLAQLDSETVTGLALSVGFRVIEAIGWMADRRLEPPPAWDQDRRTGRCLSQVQDLVGPAWYGLLLMPRGDRGVVEAVKAVLQGTKSHHHVPSLSFQNASQLPPLPVAGGRRGAAANFLSSWLALSKARATARRGSSPEPPLLKPHVWLFPFFHEELPAAVNFAGLGGEAARRLLPEQKSGESRRDREAVLVALSALRLKAPGPTPVERLFFVASCRLLCAGSEGSPGRTQSARRRCNGAVMPLPAFRHAFQCPRHGRYETN